MVEAGAKRKRPPTFHHLPVNRAKKLKRAWVETVKIKSKWKAQKRKEGGAPSASAQQGDNEKREDSSGSEAEDSDAGEDQEGEEGGVPALKTSSLHPSRAHIHPELVPMATPKTRPAKMEEEQPSAPSPSLRDLTREAYSRASLHTYKADPLKRRRGSAARGHGGRGARGGEGGRGRGQPNMKLRMDAMLEKIKRDLT